MFYSTKQIAKMLNVNEETVRRWIRDGKLKANSKSRKQGNKISIFDLNKFYDQNPKYAKRADIRIVKSEISEIAQHIKQLEIKLEHLKQELKEKSQTKTLFFLRIFYILLYERSDIL